MRLLPFLLALLMAGCVTPAAEDVAPAAADPGLAAAAAEPVTTASKVSLAVARPTDEDDASQKGAVDVPANATVLVVEAKWRCASPTCAFHLQLLLDGEEVDSARGTGEADFQVKAPKPGAYAVKLRSAGPALQMAGEIRTTAFFGEAPKGFTAFE